MNKIKSVLFVAGILLALAFTFSCSSDDGGPTEQSYKYCITADGCLAGPITASICKGQVSNSCPNGSSPSVGGSSSSKGGGSGSSSSGNNGQSGSFNQNSQIYNEDGRTLYKGSGVIEATHGIACDPGSYDVSGSCEWNRIKVGNVANGIVNLELNKAVPTDEYLRDFLDDDDQLYCSSYPENIESAGGMFLLTNGNDITGHLDIYYYEVEQFYEGIYYIYFTKTGKITCNVQYEYEGEIYKNRIININAQKGWNKIYYREYERNGVRIEESNTSNILTKEKEMKWYFREWDW